MKIAMVLTQGPGSDQLEKVFHSASEALSSGDEVVVFADVEGVKAMGHPEGDGLADLSALQRSGAKIVLCRFCTVRQGLDLDPSVLVTASTGDLDDLSRLIAWADKVVCP